ncbi:hypothetical protein HOLDEFILI_00880 [Holdemania filiformis DSM 12042]|uniref:Uncharacterized protein n=1 Tax=Holdemania filiformis DSM 12042 TaxID=545696 RepID=B9Y4Z8_9FIRM|nr:hypothetical protein HOLDEFILI_00880 [Holdemania filiformis DSM 12042]
MLHSSFLLLGFRAEGCSFIDACSFPHYKAFAGRKEGTDGKRKPGLF